MIDPYHHFSMELLASNGMGGKLLVSVNYQKPFKSCVFWKLERSTRNVTWSPSSTLVRKKLGWLTHIRTPTSDVPSPRSQSHWQSQNTWRICGYPKHQWWGFSQPLTPTSCGTRGKKNLLIILKSLLSKHGPSESLQCFMRCQWRVDRLHLKFAAASAYTVMRQMWKLRWMVNGHYMGKTLALILKYKESIFIRTTYERPTGECSSSSLIEDHGCWNMWAGFTTLWHPLMLAG